MNQHKYHSFIAVVVMLFVAAPLLRGQADNRVTVPLTDPARPARVTAHLLNGSITVKGADVRDIVVEARVRGGSDRSEARTEEGRSGARSEAGGMHRIPVTSTGLSIDADNNQVRITTDSINRTVDLTITVPVRTSLVLRSVNDGGINVTGVDGEFDIDNVNGPVTLKNVSGSVVAHALNDRLLVTMNRVDPQKPMAFSSLNGDIDVTFPADLKATVSMRTDNGEVYSDFDVQLQANAPKQTVEDGRAQGGKYRVRVDKTVRGTINGGGQDIQFKNFNGNIYIRKAGGKQ